MIQIEINISEKLVIGNIKFHDIYYVDYKQITFVLHSYFNPFCINKYINQNTLAYGIYLLWFCEEYCFIHDHFKQDPNCNCYRSHNESQLCAC